MGLFNIFKKKNEIKKFEGNNTDTIEENNTNIPKIKYGHNEFGDYLSLDSVNEEIENLKNHNVKLPSSLESYFLKNGYGFIHTQDSEESEYVKRILSPIEILDFINGNYEDLGIYDTEKTYDEIKNKGLIFMELCEQTFLWIGTQSNNYNCIYYFDDKIADSMDEFIDKLHKEGTSIFNI